MMELLLMQMVKSGLQTRRTEYGNTVK